MTQENQSQRRITDTYMICYCVSEGSTIHTVTEQKGGDRLVGMWGNDRVIVNQAEQTAYIWNTDREEDNVIPVSIEWDEFHGGWKVGLGDYGPPTDYRGFVFIPREKALTALDYEEEHSDRGRDSKEGKNVSPDEDLLVGRPEW